MPTNRSKTPQLKQKKLQKTCIEKKKTLDSVGQRKRERKKRKKTKKEEGWPATPTHPWPATPTHPALPFWPTPTHHGTLWVQRDPHSSSLADP